MGHNCFLEENVEAEFENYLGNPCASYLRHAFPLIKKLYEGHFNLSVIDLEGPWGAKQLSYDRKNDAGHDAKGNVIEIDLNKTEPTKKRLCNLNTGMSHTV